MSDAKSVVKSSAACALAIDVVAGTGGWGATDGPLSECKFNYPFGLCRYGDSLFVADQDNGTIRAVEGVLGVANPMAEGKDSGADGGSASPFEVRTVPLIMTAISVVPKELARLMAQYA